MSQDKTDITVETYDNIVEEYISYFKTKNLNGNDTLTKVYIRKIEWRRQNG